LDEEICHGIYLVGWTGKLGTWKKAAGRRPTEKTAASLADALRRQAREFRVDHSKIDIRTVVWDLHQKNSSGAAVAPQGG
jgi:hypothetical protein